MRWYISYPILAAGLAFAVDVLFPGEPGVLRQSASLGAAHDLDAQVPQPPDAAPTVVAASDDEFSSRLSAFSPGARFARADMPRVSVLDYLAEKLSPFDFTPSVTTPAVAQPALAGTWRSAVIRQAEPAYQTASVVEQSAKAGRTATSAKGASSRGALARDIQAELQRVGCYVGEIDGVWGSGSKRGALMFMDRVNASLPTQDPDVFMLSLLRAQGGSVCGSACPYGQSAASNGRCLPSTLVAQADRNALPASPRGADIAMADIDTGGMDTAGLETANIETGAIKTGWAPVTQDSRTEDPRALVRPPMPYGRMSIGGPKPMEDALAQPSASPTTTRPITADRLARIAALEASDDPSALGPDLQNVTASSFDKAVDEPPVRRVKSAAKPSRSKSAGQSSSRGGTYRHVQRLFEHPLGRM